MLKPETLVTLEIHPADGGGFQCAVAVEGVGREPPRPVSLHRYRELHFVIDLFRRHFKESGPEHLAVDAAITVGVELFNLWLAPAWAAVEGADPTRPLTLVVTTPLLELLNLPWELLLPPGHPQPLGVAPRWAIRRAPSPTADGLGRCCVRLRPPPLRVLFQSCTPEGLPPLEGEPGSLAALLVATLAPLGRQAAWEVVEGGEREGLRAALHRFQPHLLHLHGHALIKGGRGYFAFEEASGAADVRSADELARELLAGSGVECLVLSGREPGHPPPVAAVAALAAGVVAHQGVPLVLGWPDHPATPVGQAMLESLYTRLAEGHSLDDALLRARRAGGWESPTPSPDQASPPHPARPEWSLPVVYAATTQGLLFNPAAPSVPPPPREPPSPAPLPGIPTAPPVPLRGRETLLNRLVATLREEGRSLLLLEGAVGSGVTGVAVELAHRWASETGHPPMGVLASGANPPGALRLVERLAQACRQRGLAEAAAALRDERTPLGERLEGVLDLLRQHPLVVILEGGERLLRPAGGWYDPHLGRFLAGVASLRHAPALVVVTATAPLPPLPDPRGHPLPLVRRPIPPLPPGSALEEWCGDPGFHGRLAWGEWPVEPLRLLSARSAPHPGSWQLLSAWLRWGEPPTLTLEGVTGAADPLERVLPDLLAGLPAGWVGALARMALLPIPLPLPLLARVGGVAADELTDQVEEWRDRALLIPFPPLRGGGHPPTGGEAGEPLSRWLVPPLLVPWLTTPPHLPEEERRAAHRAAGALLADLFDQNREGDLGLTWMELLREAHGHFLGGGALSEALAVGERLAMAHRCQGDRHGLVLFSAAWPPGAPLPAPWPLDDEGVPPPVAHLDLSHAALAQGCPAAGLGYILAALTRVGREGDENREVVREAFLLLARLAREEGNPAGALELAAISACLEGGGGQGGEPDLERLGESLAATLNQPRQELARLVRRAWEAYRGDGGWGVVDKTFGLGESRELGHSSLS